MTQQPTLPGLEEIVAEFDGAACWPGLLMHVRQVMRQHDTFTVDDLIYQGDRDQRITSSRAGARSKPSSQRAHCDPQVTGGLSSVGE